MQVNAPGSVSTNPKGKCELRDANQYHNTVQAGLGLNPSVEQYSSVADLVIGSDLVYPDKVNAPLHDCTNTKSDFIPIYDISYAGIEGKFANSKIHF